MRRHAPSGMMVPSNRFLAWWMSRSRSTHTSARTAAYRSRRIATSGGVYGVPPLAWIASACLSSATRKTVSPRTADATSSGSLRLASGRSSNGSNRIAGLSRCTLGGRVK